MSQVNQHKISHKNFDFTIRVLKEDNRIRFDLLYAKGGHSYITGTKLKQALNNCIMHLTYKGESHSIKV